MRPFFHRDSLSAPLNACVHRKLCVMYARLYIQMCTFGHVLILFLHFFAIYAIVIYNTFVHVLSVCLLPFPLSLSSFYGYFINSQTFS